jgi:hypothetical protein
VAVADTTRLTWCYVLVWCLVALALLIVSWRFWNQPPGRLDRPSPSAARVGLGV